jgi:Protein of unknown function (DUF3244).
MKRSLILCMLLAICSLGNTYSSQMDAKSKDTSREVELKAKKIGHTKSLSLPPGIKAYIYEDRLEILFEETIPQNVGIEVTMNDNEIICSETLQVNSPMTWDIPVDWDENSSYLLEISTRDWHFLGYF